jgi:hypothetical protein
MTAESLRTIGLYLLGGMLVSLTLALLMLLVILRQARQIDVPPGAGFAETLLYTPLLIVLFIDLLDFALDFLAAPVAWIFLDRLGLKALRGVSAVEAAIPLTQVVPTMTLCWIGARLLAGPASRYSQIDETYL